MFNFKKIASIASSTLLMIGTGAMAMAANYPAPFVQNGNADVAIVVGSSAAFSDTTAANTISTDLSQAFTAQGGGNTVVAPTGESYALFTTSSELFMNSTVNNVRETLTSAELPTILADETFQGAASSGSSSVQYTQKIVIGNNPKVDFAQMPDSDSDPKIGISFSTTVSTNPLYNATLTFDENVNFTSADSIGEDIMLFGQKFTVGAASTTTKLVLLKSSQTVDLTSDSQPSATVSVDGADYTIELVAATDTGATIKVTDSAGSTDTKEISESTSKKIMGLEVSVDRADENNFRLTATVSVGSNRVTLQDGASVKVGSDEDTVDGTQVEFYLANGTVSTNPNQIGKIDVQVAAPDSDNDAIFPGQSFEDPVFGSFKFDFTGVSNPVTDTENRETIEVKANGNDKMNVIFQSYAGSDPKTVTWVFNKTTAQGTTEGAGLGGMILGDNDGDQISVVEGMRVNKSQYVVIPNNKDGGSLYEVTSITNSSSTTASDDYVRLKNVFTGEETSDLKATTEGTITTTIEGKTMTILYNGASDAATELRQVRFNSPESTSNDIVLFPTIKTSKGAKVAFYQPTRINLENFNGVGAAGYAGNVTSLLLPDGDDAYTDVDVVRGTGAGAPFADSVWNFTFGSTTRNINTTLKQNSSGAITVGQLTYNITGGLEASTSTNTTIIYLQNPEGGNIVRPALIVFEEKDDGSTYNAAIVTLDGGYDGANNDIGVSDIIRTFGADVASLGNEIQLETDSDLYQDMDVWGSLFSLDKSDSDQASAMISYPDDQIEATVYVSESTSSSGGGGVLGNIVVKDSDVSTVSTKNLIVVGGSCINSAAQKLVDSSATAPICGSMFTQKMQVSAGQYLIKTFASPWSSGKVATLVAGYNAEDTTNAASALTTQTVDTTAGTGYTGTTATSIEPITA